MKYFVKNDLSQILDNRFSDNGDGTMSGYRKHKKLEVYNSADFSVIDISDEHAIFGINKDLFKIVSGKAELKTTIELQSEADKKDREEARKRLKAQLLEDMSKTTVTIGDRVFWADPDSEQNFAGRIRQLEIQGLKTTKWQQGFDTFEVTLDELKQVVAEGTVKNAALWDAYIEAVEALKAK